jgi:hypothetical protein
MACADAAACCWYVRMCCLFNEQHGKVACPAGCQGVGEPTMPGSGLHLPSCNMEINHGQGKALSVDLLRMLKMMLNAYLQHVRPVTHGNTVVPLHLAHCTDGGSPQHDIHRHLPAGCWGCTKGTCCC